MQLFNRTKISLCVSTVILVACSSGGGGGSSNSSSPIPEDQRGGLAITKHLTDQNNTDSNIKATFPELNLPENPPPQSISIPPEIDIIAKVEPEPLLDKQPELEVLVEKIKEEKSVLDIDTSNEDNKENVENISISTNDIDINQPTYPVNIPKTSIYVQQSVDNLIQTQKQLGKNVIVGLIDSGLYPKLASLAGRSIGQEMYSKSGDGTIIREATRDTDTRTIHGSRMAYVIFLVAPDIHLEVAGALGSTAANRLLAVEQSAMILNNSWALAEETDPQYDLWYKWNALEHWVIAVERGALIVKATGNNGLNDSFLFSRAPLLRPELLAGFLAVTGDSRYREQDHPNDLIANACGRAKDWCLAAPMLAYLPRGDRAFSFSSGTSIATAFVSGVAAAVKTRYPWMTNTNLKETLLGTADDIGEPGIDNRYGWGLVNLEKALRGYGQFSWGQSTLTIPDEQIAYFDNAIFGTGGFIKQGSGTLVLNNNNTFTGLSDIQQGTVVINGTNTSSMNVASSARLVVGDVPNVSVGNLTLGGVLDHTSSSDLFVNGNYTQSESGLVKKVLGSVIRVNGTASLAGHLWLTGYADGFVPDEGATITILIAKKGVSGQWDIDSRSVLQNISTQTNPNSVTIKLENKSIIEALANSNDYPEKANVIEKTESLLTKMNEDFHQEEGLSAEQEAFYSNIVTATSSEELNTILFNTQNTAIYSKGLYMDNLNLLSAQRTLWRNLNLENNLWVEYQQQKLRTNIQSLSSESQTNRILLGRSVPALEGNFGVELSLGQLSWKDKLNNAQHTTHHQTTSISMGYRYTGLGINWLTSVGYGYISGKVQTEQKDTFTAHQYTAGIAASRQFTWDDLQVTPTAGLQYINTHSGSSASARILALNASQLTLHLGLATEYMLRDNLKAYLNIGFERDIKQTNQQTVRDLTVEYQSNIAMPTNHFTVKLGTDWNITERWKIGASYEYSTSQQWDSHNLNLSTSYYY